MWGIGRDGLRQVRCFEIKMEISPQTFFFFQMQQTPSTEKTMHAKPQECWEILSFGKLFKMMFLLQSSSGYVLRTTFCH